MPTSGSSVTVSSIGTSVNGVVRSLRVGATAAVPGNGQVSLPETGQVLWGVSGNKGIGGNANGTFFVQANNDTAGTALLQVFDLSDVQVVAAVSQGAGKAGVATTPLASQAPGTALVLGTAWQNPNAYDVELMVVLGITANTSLVISLGVGPTNTPAQQTLVTGSTLTGFLPLRIKVPAGYWALLSSSGTGTLSILGQCQENS